MRSLNLKNIAAGLGLGLAFLAGSAIDAQAQSQREIQRQIEAREAAERQQYEYQRQQYEYQRQQQRNARRNSRYRDRNDNGRYYGGQQSVEDLSYFPGTPRQAMNATLRQGYSQGLMAGQFDARKKKYNQSNVYRNTGSRPNSGDPSGADYLYRQGYLEGYEDGYYGRRRY
jgi:hypothetical protein